MNQNSWPHITRFGLLFLLALLIMLITRHSIH